MAKYNVGVGDAFPADTPERQEERSSESRPDYDDRVAVSMTAV